MRLSHIRLFYHFMNERKIWQMFKNEYRRSYARTITTTNDPVLILAQAFAWDDTTAERHFWIDVNYEWIKYLTNNQQ